MIEVFKTNVTSAPLAALLLYEIHEAFPGCCANFDLQDCDHILRVVRVNGTVHTDGIIELLRARGFSAEPLPDEPPDVRDLYSAELTLLGGFRALALDPQRQRSPAPIK